MLKWGGGGESRVWIGMRVEMARRGKLAECHRTMWVNIVRTYCEDGANKAMSCLQEDRVVDDMLYYEQ